MTFEYVCIMSPSKKKRRAYEGEIPDMPDPGENGAEFLAWIKNLGYIWPLKKCEVYCQHVGLDIDRFVKDMGPERISLRRNRNGEKVVLVEDKTWASKWARKSRCDRAHHRHTKKL